MSIQSRRLFDIRNILRHEQVVTFFQPIISLKTCTVIGVEALCRGLDVSGDASISPVALFQAAAKKDCVLELDRLCRQTAFTTFPQACTKYPDALLFVNFDVATVDLAIVGSDYLLHQVMHAGLDPHTVVIEIIESKVHNLQALHCFIERYKSYGFLIALDDVGSGHSNLDRISLIKPDILKIDRALIRDIDREYYKQMIFRSLVDLAGNTGALVVAEGIERREEAITSMELGADMLQGFYFAHPQDTRINPAYVNERCIHETAGCFRQYMIEKIHRMKVMHHGYDQLLKTILQELDTRDETEFDAVLVKTIADYPSLECLYVLNGSGVQVSETVCNPGRFSRPLTPIFHPANRGTDHSLKEYFYLLLNAGIEKYTTVPYISLATGNRCITISSTFCNVHGLPYVLCIDVFSD